MNVEEFASKEFAQKVRNALSKAFDEMDLKTLKEYPFIRDRLLTNFTHEVCASCM